MSSSSSSSSSSRLSLRRWAKPRLDGAAASPLNESLLSTAETDSIASTSSPSTIPSYPSPPSPITLTPPSPPLQPLAGSASFASDCSTSSSSPSLVKRIGYVGSVALLVNNVTGGGMVLFAQVYQQAGWLMPTLTLLLLLCVTLLCSLMLISCMSLLPGNGRFRRRVEYSDIARHFLARPLYLLSFLFYQLALLCTNIALIIQSVQCMDFAIAAVLGHSCLVPQLTPSIALYSCPAAVEGGITVFADGVKGVSIGFAVTALATIPLALFNLDDNIVVQKAAFLLLLSICAVWCALFAERGLVLSRVPAVGSTFAPVIGVCFANFAFLSCVPSWMNEKREQVPIARSVSLSLTISVLMFVVTALLCGLSFEPWTGSATLLDQVLSLGTPLAKVTFYVFPIVANLTSIPVNSIFQRLNLTSQGVHRYLASFLAVVLPWLIAMPLYYGQGYLDLALWSGVLVTSTVNFIIPPALYIIAIRSWNRSRSTAALHGQEEGGALEDEEEEAQEPPKEEDEEEEDGEGGADGGGGGVGERLKREEAVDDDVWHVLPPRYQHLQLALGVVVLVTMVALCVITLVLTVVG